MTEAGLVAVPDAVGLFLADRRTAPRARWSRPRVEGARPMLVEVQALVADARATVPRRVAHGRRRRPAGAAARRARTARRHRHPARRRLRERRRRRARRGDRASTSRCWPRSRASPTSVVIDDRTVVVGEVGLGGEVRGVAHAALRVAEAARLGFTRVVGPTSLPRTAGRRGRRGRHRGRRARGRVRPVERRGGPERPGFADRGAAVDLRVRSDKMLAALRLVAPGTPLREGLDRILPARMGALIVVGAGPDVLSVCSGGFLLDAEFTPQRLSELAKMDGAIIVSDDCTRIVRANVHLVPDPNIPTSETGTRHRTAERVARQIDVPVITISEDRSVVAVHVSGEKQTLEPTSRVLGPRRPGAPDPRAVQGPPRRGEQVAVGARGRGPRDRARRRHRAAAGRDGAAHRRGDRGLRHRARRRRPAGAAPARGADGRRRGRPAARRQGLLRRGGRLGARRRARPPRPPRRRDAARPRRGRDGAAPPADTGPRQRGRSRAASGCCTRSRACPSSCPTTSSSGSRTCRRSCGPASPTSPRSKASARCAPARSRKASRASPRLDPRAVRLTGRSSRPQATARPIEVEHITLRGRRRRRRSRRSTRGPTACPSAASCCTPTSWASGRCSTTCAGASRRTASRCARPSRSPARRSTCAPPTIRRRAWRTCRSSTTTLQLGDLERAADYLVVHDDVARGRGARVLHGRHVRAEGRGDRALRPRGRVLRDDPRARRLARARSSPSRSTPPPTVCPTLAIFGGDDTFTPAADIEALRAAWADRPDCEIVVYPDAEHGFVHDARAARAPRRRRRRRLAPRARVPRRRLTVASSDAGYEGCAGRSQRLAVEDVVAAAARRPRSSRGGRTAPAPCSPARATRRRAPARSSWVIGSWNSSASPASSSRRFAVRAGHVEEHRVGEGLVGGAEPLGQQAHDDPEELGPCSQRGADGVVAERDDGRSR